MLSRRTSLRTAVAVLGAGAALTLTMSAPAFAANEGDHWLTTANCTADQKIELQLYSDGQYHDFQAIDPTRINGNCEFVLLDGRVGWDSFSGAQSPWYYDGPGRSYQAYVIDHTSGQVAYGIRN
ncbi:hypothetical protein OG500_37590 [Kitasatospora sp. NBC_01250]|uniref:hypothetical protein n=1 Tax=unclassified Kitasatospora TaxID=2633591 RepID=UPI002E112D52|nr:MULTISPECIES: hypothetical protein [unclassified Kitasatospora]WSJ71657.1 hypothetical protein OG294_39280 [Kitasatospora sp. NBC_01302]